jgi:hypothetical protein
LRDALARATRRVIVEVLTPPYDAAGVGTLRVVRVLVEGDRLELTAAYEGYARL